MTKLKVVFRQEVPIEKFDELLKFLTELHNFDGTVEVKFKKSVWV